MHTREFVKHDEFHHRASVRCHPFERHLTIFLTLLHLVLIDCSPSRSSYSAPPLSVFNIHHLLVIGVVRKPKYFLTRFIIAFSSSSLFATSAAATRSTSLVKPIGIPAEVATDHKFPDEMEQLLTLVCRTPGFRGYPRSSNEEFFSKGVK